MDYTATILSNPLFVPGTLTIDETTVASSYVVEYRESGNPLFWTGDGNLFWSGDGNFFWTPAGAFLPWPGSYAYVSPVEVQVRISTAGGGTQGEISNFHLVVDVPDLFELVEDFVVPPGGARVSPLANVYRKIVNVNVDLQDTGTGARSVLVVDKDVSGPLLRVVDGGGVPVVGVVDVEIQGY